MSPLSDVVTASAGLLAARLVLGMLLVGHGLQKLAGWFGGYGLNGTAGFFEGLGFRPGRRFVIAAALTEIVGGSLLALGLLGPIGPALVLSVMIVAAVSVHWKNGIFAAANGIELPLVFGAGALAIALTGPGIYSLDSLLGFEWLWSARAALIALAIGVVGAVANLGARRPAVS